MLATPKGKGGLFLASSLCDGLEDNNIRQVVTLLLNKDADPNVLIPMHGVTPFHLVIGNDSEDFAEEVTKLFLRHGGNPNVRSSDGMTPVHVAAAWGRINILQLLLANGGDPLCLDNDGRSPFHYAFDGKYFKAVTILSNHCESIQDEDDKPKYNMALDKVLITNGDIVAEYVTSKDTMSNLDNMTIKSVLTDCKANSSSMIVNLNNALDVHNIETKCKLLNNLDEYSKAANTMTAQLQNNLIWTHKKEKSNYSFIDLDFDFANLHLSDVMQKEKCFVSQIINHLSSSLASDCTINETLHNYKRNKCEESDSDMPFELKKDEDTYYKYKYYENSKDHLQHNISNNEILKFNTPNLTEYYSKYCTQNTSKKQHKKNSNEILVTPSYILDNSIISMSPNFNTPNHRKGKNIAKTPLTPSYINNDPIVSKSPNFTTPVCTTKKRNLSKTSCSKNRFSTNVFKKLCEYKTQTQYSELNWHKKHIAQSTPRRKKRSIYKFHSGKKRFNPYRYESDVTSDEFTADNKLKPVDLNKTIFLEKTEDTRDILDTSSEYSSLNVKESLKVRFSQNHCNNYLVTKLDEGRYDEDGKISDNSNLLENSFNQMEEKENKYVNNFNNVKKYAKSDNYNVDTKQFITIRKDIFKIDKTSKMIDAFTNNIKSTCTTESDMLHRENFIDCVDCDTKKLLNEDLDMNISKTCNLHAKNWCNNEFHESHKLIIENNSLPNVNLPMQCKKQIYLLDSEKSSSSKLENNTDFKKIENIPKIKSIEMSEIEKNSSMLSYVSAQEYKYEDPEEGVILLERRLCITPFRRDKAYQTYQFFSTFSGIECDVKNKMITSDTASSQNLPEELLFIDDVTLRQELRQLGDQPGPITDTTRQLYQKRLMHLKNVKDTNIPSMLNLQNISQNHVKLSDQINSHLEFGDWLNHIDTYKSLEKHVFQEFVLPDPSRRWREGKSKTSFTYLLLDPRITQDLPNRSVHLTQAEVWSIFLNAIFYIGKGKRSRPFNHLYDAFKTWVDNSTTTSKKIKCILDIWNSDHGVICLHIFQNIIPVEAYTREAAMIDAIGREHLDNCKSGEYYGIAATWSMQQKQKFGRYLLYKALQIFMQEGERQLFPQHL